MNQLWAESPLLYDTLNELCDSGSVQFLNGKENCIHLEQHTGLILEQSIGFSLSLSGTKPRPRDLWVVAFNPQRSLGVLCTTGE